MITANKPLVVGAAWLTGAAALWLAAVPSLMSFATLCWVNAAVAGVATVFAAAMRSARPTRSIAHVLYETEHQVRSER